MDGDVAAPAHAATGNPTEETYSDLSLAYEVFNRELFDGRLSPCLITLRAHGRTFGYFHPFRFLHPDGRRAHEIALNPEAFSYRTIEACLSTLAHEQVHLSQHEDGVAPKSGYHNKDFATRMAKIGLITSSTGGPGGREVGYTMSHYIDEQGRFMSVVRALLDREFRARWGDRFVKKVYPEWTPGKPDRPAAVPPPRRKAPSTSAQDPAVTASEPGVQGPGVNEPAIEPAADPAPVAAPPPAPREPAELIEELKSTALPGGAPPPLAQNPDAFELQRKVLAKQKLKYQCPGCRCAAWGKPGLQLVCAPCQTPLVQQGASAPNSTEDP